EQRQVLAHVGAADGELHDAQQDVVAGWRRGVRPVVAEAHGRAERDLARLRLLLYGEATLRQAEQEWVRSQLVAQQRQITGDVGERGQQRRQLRVLEKLPDLLVRLRDRLDRTDERAERGGDLAETHVPMFASTVRNQSTQPDGQLARSAPLP